MIEFLDDLTSVKHRAAILADIDLLASEGPILPFPLTSAIAAHRGLREYAVAAERARSVR
jgi:hypothetical protein